MARRIIRRGVRGGARRATFWETVSSVTSTTLIDGGVMSSVIPIVTEAELDNVPNPTLVRVRGQIFAQMGPLGAVVDGFLLSHAIMVVDAKQLAIGTSAMPLPLSSNSEDFLWFGQQFVAAPVAASLNDVDQYSGTFDRLIVDSKAMRKVTLNQSIVLVSELEQWAGGAGDVRFALNLRMLFKK